MNKYEDGSMVKGHRVQVLLTEDEYKSLSVYRQNIRAPSLSGAARELLLDGLKTYSKDTQNLLTFEETNNERKESNKEKKETKKELCLVEFLIDDASRDATNAKKILSLDERKNAFWQRLVPYIEKGLYPREMVTAFYQYWTELNESGRRMRFEQEKFYELPKRLATWKSREPRNNGLPPEQMADQLRAKRRREEATEELLRQFDDAQANAVSYKEFITIKK